MQQTTLTSKGQVTIPKKVRDALGLHFGDKIEFVMTDKNEVLLRPITKKVDDVFGLLFQANRKPVSVEEMDAAIRQKMQDGFK
ncbi:AbrB/MazE/SpoVT family DNA-binding domain-containing protein [Methylovulum miyakonense]|uniref:AbrB/MazE/SpoVT family DNA-binding domain-containing protein n=1 Tax=Methylovulum miyakonense TaxID=645578 RepID=UPI00035D89C2|nr:AbrB/MazE/SpoVT family DNA-binding domain-containing protein [Methylovulum miyakonense]